MSPIKHWPQSERPREKLLLQGSKTLSDAELLAIFLRTGTYGKTAVDLARDLLAQTGGLRYLFNLDSKAFCRYHGLGLAKYTQLQAVLEMGRRHLFEPLKKRNVLESASQTQRYMISKLADLKYEVFACLLLDSRFHAIDFYEIFRGSVSRANVYPGEVVKQALRHDAAAMIVAHNHPSGDLTPSKADKALTQTLKNALDLVEVRLLDHIIVAGNQALSFAEKGYL
ncbi:MAG: DNA repair protein RadC [Pseudomonadota bacterium]